MTTEDANQLLLKMALNGQQRGAGALGTVALFSLGLLLGAVMTATVGYATLLASSGSVTTTPASIVTSVLPGASGDPAPTGVPSTVDLQPSPAATVSSSNLRTATPGPSSDNVRVAQSSNGLVYAYDPVSGLALEMRGNDVNQTTTTAFPQDVKHILLAGSPTQTGVATTAELDAQTARAFEALRQQAETDERRPPINERLQSDTQIVAQLRTILDKAVGYTRPTGDGSDDRAVVYAFFDPQCPYCHAAYDGLDGRFAIKWMPVSVLGDGGHPLHSYMMGPTTPAEEEDGAVAVVSDGAADRLHQIMADDHRPANQPLSDGHQSILAQNAEIFRLLSQGAEHQRAVPSFFIASDNGKAVWLRGFDEDTPALMADIIAGKSS